MEDIEYIVELPDWPDYLISTFGDAYSEKSGNMVKLKPGKGSNGYLTVVLCKDGTTYTKYIHRLVGETLIKKVKGKEFIDHIDRNRLNNRIENLRWCNKRENSINRGLSKCNTSGIKGVCYDNYYNKWKARICISKGKEKQKYFKLKEDAIKWREEMEKKYYKI